MAQALDLSILSRIGISSQTHNLNMASPDARLELHPGCNNAQQISARHKKKDGGIGRANRSLTFSASPPAFPHEMATTRSSQDLRLCILAQTIQPDQTKRCGILAPRDHPRPWRNCASLSPNSEPARRHPCMSCSRANTKGDQVAQKSACQWPGEPQNQIGTDRVKHMR